LILSNTNTIIAIVGPTAVGKTITAIDVAKALHTEIVSFDSRQFFKELQIGTAKPSSGDLAEVKHHFIGNLSIQEDYDACKFEHDVLNFLDSFFRKKNVIVFCGGSGMYLNAVAHGFDEQLPSANPEIRKQLNSIFKNEGLQGLQDRLQKLDPEYFEIVDQKNPKRLLRAIEVSLLSGKSYTSFRKKKFKKRPFKLIQIGLEMDRQMLYRKINQRVDQMMNEGLLEEAKQLLPFRDKNALKTVGYKELFLYLDGFWDLETAIEKIKTNSRRYAKRQMTWFKKDNEIEWFESGENTKIIQYIRKRLTVV